MLLPGTLRHLPHSRDIRAGLFPFLSPSKVGIVSLRCVLESVSSIRAFVALLSPCPFLQVRGQDLRRQSRHMYPPCFPCLHQTLRPCAWPVLRLFQQRRRRCGVRLVHSCGSRNVSFRQLCVFLFPYWQRIFLLTCCCVWFRSFDVAKLGEIMYNVKIFFYLCRKIK